ncbi:hypothetical protein EGR_03278 [Echinococcus granulosus]|uniref:Uncharacterized protein n=1 Tax=Echinococcus granulosus TaxID=6210 RepID=W6UTN0_ECHGR|nr:hypothetical protein EGR_03278 [Echinococcus granulosus]EUB61732.1 hypothetical protein EGR_03278 [Echinococcus granulosus]
MAIITEVTPSLVDAPVQHERGPRNSTLRRQIALMLQEQVPSKPRQEMPPNASSFFVSHSDTRIFESQAYQPPLPPQSPLSSYIPFHFPAPPLLPSTSACSKLPDEEAFMSNLLPPLPLPPPPQPQVLSKAEAFGIDNLLNDSPIVRTQIEEQGDEDERTLVRGDSEPRIPPQTSIISEELAVCVKGILLSIMTWISTFRPDRQLLRTFLQPTTYSSTFQLTPREIARLMSTSWPRVFILEAIEVFLKGQDSKKLISFLAKLCSNGDVTGFDGMSCPIRGAFLKVFGCSMENIDRMIERMTFAAVEAAIEAAVKPP